MRVIAGSLRSRPLAAPRGRTTRPTSDRLRETLFNILASRIETSRFADLYAGSGAVGIEAHSRGAAHVAFAENDPSAIAAIQTNLRSLGITHGVTLEPRGVGALLATFTRKASPSPPLDLVFLDPPWESANEYSATLVTLGGRAGPAILAPGALVIVEHATRTPLPLAAGALRQTRILHQGDAALTFYQRDPAPRASASDEPALEGAAPPV